MYIIKEMNLKHCGMTAVMKGKDGRCLKQRKKGRLSGSIELVLKTKDGAPQAADVMKTARSTQNKIVNYNSAYRAIQSSIQEVFRIR